MKTIKGDIVELAKEGCFDVIVHGCNCFCTMGAGLARQIKQEFPLAYKADLATEKGSRSKLGSYSKAVIPFFGHEIIVINAYTQFNWRGDGIKADYEAIRMVFQQIKREFNGLRIAYPMIGAGLAGGDWKIIAEIVVTELENENHTLVEFAH